ncbi:TRAP transporter small permease [Vibrio lentus]|uniref:TRAP transporter small permease protein n=1 Tax=Vibrio lentus TaxID=136468 RepID=A0AB36XNB8_9VIBR|nr:TRAP transporter small permease [Vibrio lentus]MCC4835177.1 TRAP transporter small permease [Vibrio lentus]PMI17259.1 C4-dicarboxylate ABC transporter permease [Vibrio lentus]PMK34304.1 C4-dicarboxylate ABC transporter permease [Vibrio lentus]PMK47953.1 C4-dicarboxylate ABC transporter permease [Vibrio lentus]PML33193.1 C4-dicarboxylate ABC transporter permease [Vibrio lentus]
MIEQYKKLLAILAGASLFNLFAVMLITTISRYFFNTSILWGEELSKYSMIYGVMFATSLCYLEGLHIKFSVLDSVKSKAFQKTLEVIVDLSVLLCSVIWTYSAYLFVIKRGGIESAGIGVPMYYFQSALIVGGACLFIAAALRLIQHVKSARVSTRTQAIQSDV